MISRLQAFVSVAATFMLRAPGGAGAVRSAKRRRDVPMTTDSRDHRIGFDTMAEVASIEFPDHGNRNGSVIAVGRFGVTRIEPYNEDGGMSYVPWFIVWRGDVMAEKVNAAHLASVIYARRSAS